MEGVKQDASAKNCGNLVELTVVQSTVALDGLSDDQSSPQSVVNLPHVVDDTAWLMLQEEPAASEFRELGSASGDDGESGEAVDSPETKASPRNKRTLSTSVPNGKEADKTKAPKKSCSSVTTSTIGKQVFIIYHFGYVHDRLFV